MSIENIIELVAEYKNIDVEEVKEDTDLLQLGFTSFQIISLVAEIQSMFDIRIPTNMIKTFHTPGDIYAFVLKCLNNNCPE